MRIPNSIEDAVLDLKGLGELMVASEWQRAAWVWAFTTEGKPGPQKDKATSGRISPTDFSKLKICGLTKRHTVAKYRKAWALAIEHGIAKDVKPGDDIKLPDADWQPYFNPPRAKQEQKKDNKQPAVPKWDDLEWDAEQINSSDRLQRMADMAIQLSSDICEAGIEGEMFARITQSVFDMVDDENKVRGVARLLHSLIEFGSSYKSKLTV